MNELIYLVHRIPYPPNKGDKIRSFHLLKHLAKSYTVHVGAFIDDADDWQHAETLAQLAGGVVKLLPLNPRLATLKSAIGILTGEPLTIPYYRDRRMQAWVDTMLNTRPIAKALAYSSSMAQYLMEHHDIRRVIDFVDMDSDKWRQYAEKKSWPMSWVYRREGQTLFDYEQRVVREFTAATFVSETEAALFKNLVPNCANKVFGFSNGVDTEYFSPEHVLPSPYTVDEHVIVFTGAMDYWANVDAVIWFTHEVFSAVKRAQPNARFYIVGSRPTPEVKSLAQVDGVEVTGGVPDTRPYIAHATIAVAPLRIARGIQNKVLEAMAMGKTVVVSPQALDGIDAEVGSELLLASGSEEFALLVTAAIKTPNEKIGQAARMRVVSDYAWSARLAGIEALFQRPVAETDSLVGVPE